MASVKDDSPYLTEYHLDNRHPDGTYTDVMVHRKEDKVTPPPIPVLIFTNEEPSDDPAPEAQT